MTTVSSEIPSNGWAGFMSELTWEQVGANIASGLISGAAGRGMGVLLDELFKRNIDIRDLFKEFADDIVARVTANLRTELAEATHKENLRELNVQSRAITENYRLYKSNGREEYLLAAEQGAIHATSEARSLGLGALGVFQVVTGMKLSIFLDKELPKDAAVEILHAKDHVARLQNLALKGARTSVGEWKRRTWNQKVGEVILGPDFSRVEWDIYEIVVNGQIRAVTQSPHDISLSEYRNGLIKEQEDAVRASICDPSARVVLAWDKLHDKLSSNKL